MLSGISVEYYTRMERGRIGGASESVLAAIARVLQLDEDERAHLADLARAAAATASTAPRARRAPIDGSVQQVLDSMSVPAIVQNERLDLLAANDLGQALYAPLFEGTKVPPNFARFAFLDARAASFYLDIERSWDLLVAILRASAGRDPYDRRLSDLVGELSTRSAEFRTRWAKHNVHRHARGRKSIAHPAVGNLDLEYNDFALPGDPNTSITTYTTVPGSSSADGLALLASWAATRNAGEQSAPHTAPEPRP